MGKEVIACMADEEKLDRCVRRLSEIMEELGEVGLFLEKSSAAMAEYGKKIKSEEKLLEKLRDEIRETKIPGFCGVKLLQEATALIDIIGVRISYLRGLGEGVNTRKIDSIEKFIREKLQPILTVSFKEMAHFGTMDEKNILETILARGSGN
jgi:superfamily II RNA helicase